MRKPLTTSDAILVILVGGVFFVGLAIVRLAIVVAWQFSTLNRNLNSVLVDLKPVLQNTNSVLLWVQSNLNLMKSAFLLMIPTGVASIVNVFRHCLRH